MITVTTDDKGVKIYRKDRQTQNGTFATYSMMISSKLQDGSWLNGFIDCRFKKGVEVANKSKIKINNAFYTCNEYNGKVYTKLIITDFDVLEGGEAPKENTTNWLDVDGTQEDLPFC